MPEDDKNKKEKYYKLQPSAIWSSVVAKEKSVAEHLGIKPKISAPATTASTEEIKYPSGRRLRTYQGDIAALVKETKASEEDIVIAEQKKRHTDAYEKKIEAVQARVRSDSFRNMLTIGIAIALLLAGGGSLYYILFRPETNTPVATDPIRPIFADKETKITLPDPISRKDFIAMILKAAEGTSASASTVTHLNFVETGILGTSALSTSRFFQLLETRAPSSLVRSLNNSFMIGAYNKTPFLLFTTTFFESAFASMLEWEGEFESDLGPLFTANLSQLTINSFEDSVVRNKDTRMLRDEIGNVLFLYSFPDRDHLVITTNERALTEILARLAKR